MKEPAAKLLEQLLILRCQAGDESAMAELIARYSPGLRLFLRKIVGHADCADDLLQETWIDAYRKINRLRNAHAVAAWLYRLARDKAYRHLRRREPVVAGDQALAESAADEAQGFSPEEVEDVRAAMDQLPLEQREVLILRFIEDMSYEQIADVVGRPLGTVRSRLHYARLALRQKLQESS